MLWNPRKAQQTTKPPEEEKPRQSRFRIERLEERIAPDRGGTPPGNSLGCLGHEHRDGSCHYHGR